jgi:precorrin-6B methylase 2
VTLVELIVIILLSLLVAALCIFAGYQILFAVTMFHGPVFVRSADDKLATMLSLPKLTKRSKVIDLGSGDGKILLALAKKFKLYGTGVEINPPLAFRSRARLAAAGYPEIKIYRQSFWKTDLSAYNVVFFYGTSYVMKKLEAKLQAELKPGTQFVTNFFKLPNLNPAKSKKGVYLYEF